MYKIYIEKINKHVLVSFEKMCNIKKLKPHLGFYKRRFNSTQSDRMNNNYLPRDALALFFGLDKMPDPDDDIQPSSWDVTKIYIAGMYGKEYAKGFKPAGFESLRKAA